MADKGTIVIEGMEERIKQLQELQTTNPAMEQRIRKVIREVIKQVRGKLASEAQSGLQMKSDPRNAYKAVRSAVYRRIFGGQVNILQSRKAGGGRFYAPPRTSQAGQRGGNRMTRSERTVALMSYQGKDRGFILRFLNAGTSERGMKDFHYDEAREHVRRGSRGGNVSKYGKTINTGTRGSIAARNWFGNRSHHEMEAAADNIDKMIDDILQGIMF